MNTKAFTAAIAALTCGAAAAQSSVSIYGLLDAGITHTSRATGLGAGTQVMSGTAQSNRLGFKGTENLGGGLHALFILESGLSLNDGALGQGGRGFSRIAVVGLGGSWGEVTMGRQFDFIGVYMPRYSVAANTPAGALAWGLPTYAAGGYTLSTRASGVSVDRAVKYVSPTLGGFTAGAMYGFGNQDPTERNMESTSFVLHYDGGPFTAAASFYSERNAVDTARNSIAVIGAAYNLGDVRVFSMVSDARLRAGIRPRATTADIGAAYSLTNALVLAAGYQHQWRANGLRDANQITATIDYKFSSRTDIYTVAGFGRDKQFGAQVVAAFGSPSPTNNQSALRIGVRHRF